MSLNCSNMFPHLEWISSSCYNSFYISLYCMRGLKLELQVFRAPNIQICVNTKMLIAQALNILFSDCFPIPCVNYHNNSETLSMVELFHFCINLKSIRSFIKAYSLNDMVQLSFHFSIIIEAIKIVKLEYEHKCLICNIHNVN